MDKEQRHALTVLSRFTVCQLADALGPSCIVETAIHPIDPNYRICGAALTVECAPGDNLTLHHALHLAHPGDVLVVGGSPDHQGALWGELMSVSAQSRGVAGTIIDGPARDPLEIRALGYPVFSRRFHPCRASKEKYGSVNSPVRIGTLAIDPGDFVVADVNGIVKIPFGQIPETIELASEVVRKENHIRTQILNGRTLFDILDLARLVKS